MLPTAEVDAINWQCQVHAEFDRVDTTVHACFVMPRTCFQLASTAALIPACTNGVTTALLSLLERCKLGCQ